MESILLTAIGSFAADIAIKNLKKLGYRIVACDIYPKEWVADAYNVDSFYTVATAKEEEAYIKDIFDICRKENIRYIIPIIDLEVDIYNNKREIFEAMGIEILISSKPCIDICRNKLNTYKLFKDDGRINLINSYTVHELNELIIKGLDVFPIVAKPYDGRSSVGLKVIENKYIWEAFTISTDTSRYVIQSYIEGDIITVDVIRDKFDKVISIARQELLRTVNGAGTSVRVYKDDNLSDMVHYIADKLDILGCVNLEFIKTGDGRHYLLECNPRFSGGIEFSCIYGYDCIKNHINAFLGKSIEDFKETKTMYIARKYEEYVTSIEQ